MSVVATKVRIISPCTLRTAFVTSSHAGFAPPTVVFENTPANFITRFKVSNLFTNFTDCTDNFMSRAKRIAPIKPFTICTVYVRLAETSPFNLNPDFCFPEWSELVIRENWFSIGFVKCPACSVCFFLATHLHFFILSQSLLLTFHFLWNLIQRYF